MDWSSFYLGLAGAAATVTGLLFIAIQINMDTLVADVGERSRAIARSTFTMFSLLVILPLVYLIPGIDIKGRAVFTLLVAAFGAIRVVRTWIPVWRSMIRHRVRDRLWETAWLLIGPIILYGFLGINTYQMYSADPAIQTQVLTAVAMCLLGLFSIALRNSWNLIFEAAYQRKHENLHADTK